MSKYERYIYDGPVMNNFDRVIEVNWRAETLAPSPEKAISNLKHRYKEACGLVTYSIKLDIFYLSKAVTTSRVEVEAVEQKDEEEPSCQQLTLTITIP